MEDNLTVSVARCDLDGVVESIITDPAAVFAAMKPGESLVRLFPASMIEKALHFLEAVRTHESTARWELATESREGHQPLLLSGIRYDDALYVGAVPGTDAQDRHLEEMARIVSEQSVVLRQVAKQKFELAANYLQYRSDAHLEDLTRLNNELVNLQRELVRKNFELEQLNRLKNELLGVAAHDLRNPLGIITAYSAYMLENLEPPLPEELVELVSGMHTASEFMLMLVEDLLDFSAIESGKLQLERMPADLVSLVDHNVRTNQVLANRKSIRLDVTVGPNLPLVWVDTTKIEQVLNNLIGNAVKFSPPGSEVRIAVASDGDEVTVSVADQGPGIPVAEQDKLFTPFTRLSARPTGGEKSTGLGLAICRRIVEGHGGTLTLASTAGEGATFTFALPVDQPDALADTDML